MISGQLSIIFEIELFKGFILERKNRFFESLQEGACIDRVYKVRDAPESVSLGDAANNIDFTFLRVLEDVMEGMTLSLLPQ